MKATIGGGPEGIVYVAAGNPQIAADSVLVSEFSANKVSAYEIDANGDPVGATRRDFITGLSGAEGAVIDPLTGDFLFSTFGGGNRVIVVQGFLPPLALAHFLCYKTKTTAGFQIVTDVSLDDQFELDPAVTVKKPASLCNPAEKNSVPPEDPDTHLRGYKITPSVAHIPLTNLQIRNQFGTLRLDTIKADRLLVPSAKALSGTAVAPDPASHDVDHFKCYKAKVTPGTPKFPKGIQVNVQDQFEQLKAYDVKKPSRLCTPVNKNGEGLKQPNAHLVCYKVKPAVSHVSVTGISVANQFGTEQLDTIKEEELCVPSTKSEP